MSSLRFECPACGQQMECDRACGGDVIHCPHCCAELRIPFSSAIPGELRVARAELILHAEGNAPASPAAKPEAKAKSPEKADRFVCPVCHAELESPVKSAQETKLPIARLIRQPPPVPTKPQPAPRPAPQEDLSHLPIEERERRIAAAREAHPVQPYPTMKPRLDYILSGERPPASEEPAEKKDNPPDPSIQSFNE